jgi:hypothetical protein
MEGVGADRARREVAGGAIDALELDLTGAFELGGIGVTDKAYHVFLSHSRNLLFNFKKLTQAAGA